MPFRLPWQRPVRDTPSYFELRSGIVGADGVRFSTTEKLLREYAGPVLDAAGLGTLIRQAEVWVGSGVAVGIVSLAGFLVFAPWWLALIASLAVYAGWSLIAPGLATPRWVRVLSLAEMPLVQALVFVAALSYAASQGNVSAVWAGLVGFVAFRLGAVRILFEPLLKPAFASLYPLGTADQTLRSLIFRWAIRLGVSLPGMAEMESRARAFWSRARKDKA